MLRRPVLLLLLLVGCDDQGGRDAAIEADAGDGDDAGWLTDAGGPRDAGDYDGGLVGADAGPGGPACTTFEPGERTGGIGEPALDELSGLAASRLHDGVFYAHNDSGDGPHVYLMTMDGAALGRVDMMGASARDYEDMAVGPGPDGTPWVYVGDHGDNAARTGSGGRPDVQLYRFPEAMVSPTGTSTVAPEYITLRYPMGPHDCESLAVAADGDVYLLTKEDAPMSELYVARAPLGADVTLELVATIPIAPGSRNATAMDISPGGRGLLVRSYNRVHLFVREPGETWADAILRAPTPARARPEPQGEAIAWLADGLGYLTASEGAGQGINLFAATLPCSAF